MERSYNKHYITVDEQNRIVDGFSDGFQHPADTDICINEQGGYQFRLEPDGEENPHLKDGDGIPLYKWDGQAVVARTDEEIAADRAAIPELPMDNVTMTQLAVAELAQTILGGVT